MRSRKKTILTAVVVGLTAATYTTLTASNVSPSCRAFRDQMQQLAASDGGFAGVSIEVSKRVLEQASSERYGAMPDEECTARTQAYSAALVALNRSGWAPRMGRAGDEAKQAMKDCRNKRMSGELKTRADSAECSNPRITAAFQDIGYPYMDIVAKYTTARLDMARKTDSGEDSERPLDFALLALEITEIEITRALKGK